MDANKAQPKIRILRIRMNLQMHGVACQERGVYAASIHTMRKSVRISSLRTPKQAKARVSRMILAALFFFLFTLNLPAADITWSEPIPIESDSDVLTNGSLNRAYNLGAAKRETVVHGIGFKAFGTVEDLKSGASRVSDGLTTFLVSSDGDAFASDADAMLVQSAEVSSDYTDLIQTRIVNHGYPLAVILSGLQIGKQYAFQWWTQDSQPAQTAQVLAGGKNISSVLKANTSGIANGLGSYVIGIFKADAEKQIVTATPLMGTMEISALQLRVLPEELPTIIVRQPASLTNQVSKPAILKATVLSSSTPNFQWQKIAANGTNNVVDNARISGSQTSTLRINSLSAEDSGEYRLVIESPFRLERRAPARPEGNSNRAEQVLGAPITSQPATIALVEPRTNLLINVAINNGSTAPYLGKAVLDGAPEDVWNNLDGRAAFTNITLVNALGATTPITLTLSKTDGGAVRQGLLRGVSFGTSQTVTLSHLAPNELYHLVVFSVGNMPNEGGVFSGAIEGICWGYPAANTPASALLRETNYLENPYAMSDAQGTLSFTIVANSTAFHGGHSFGDFNGLQLTQAESGPPVILHSPQPVKAHLNDIASLSVSAASPPSAPVSYYWHKITERGINAIFNAPGKADLPVGQDARQHVPTNTNDGDSRNILEFKSLKAADSGTYRVIISNRFGMATSDVARISVLTNQLFNVAISDGSKSEKVGLAVLDGTPRDTWNLADARNSFSGVPLLDSEGKTTPVTLTLSKTNGGAVPNGLLGAVSFATYQNVTISNLPPRESFNLAIFSVGNVASEGGVFSGAINGICRGYPNAKTLPSSFLFGTNYLAEPYVTSDSKGTISFSIAANSTAIPGGHTFGDFNGLQIMQMPSDGSPMILQPPASVSAEIGSRVQLEVKAKGPSTSWLSYRWQKITARTTNDLSDTLNVTGTTNAVLSIRALAVANNGMYQVAVSNRFGSIASVPVTISTVQNQLINMAANNGSTAPYVGRAVLDGSANDFWNSPDCRQSLTNFPLADSTGALTPVTLTLIKSDVGAVRHSLLGGVSFAKSQTVTLSHLVPNETYHLVVFSVGNMVNEGGVFNGAIEGISRGYPAANMTAKEFVLETNYLENLSAMSDAHGTLTFTIAPNSTAMEKGHFFGDFNGLQLSRGGAK